MYKPSCPLTGGGTDTKISFTLQNSPWDQVTVGLGQKSPPCLATSSSLLYFSYSFAVNFSQKHFSSKSHVYEPSSQGLTLGEVELGHKHYSYTAPTLKELSG